jgi:hypothetical protein
MGVSPMYFCSSLSCGRKGESPLPTQIFEMRAIDSFFPARSLLNSFATSSRPRRVMSLCTVCSSTSSPFRV